MAWGAALAGAGSIVGGYLASKAAKEAEAQRAAFTEKAIAELEKVGVPSVEAQKIALETPELVFNYAPQLEKDFPTLRSHFEQIEVDPRLKEAQSQALTGIQERAEMGLTPEEQAQLNSLRRQTGQQFKSQQEGILQQMEQRGLGGSGAELAAQLAGSQAGTQRAAEESDRLAAMQFQAKQAALAQLANVAGGIRGQEFGEQATQAGGMDAISQFNASQQSETQRRNIDSMNQAKLMQEQLKQQLEGQDVQTSNVQEQYNKGLLQQDYQNKLEKAKGLAAAYTGAGQAAAQAGANQASNIAQIGSGVGQLAGGAVDYATSKSVPTTTVKSGTGTSSLSPFGSAFAKAKESGLDEFEYDGNKYNTQTK